MHSVINFFKNHWEKVILGIMILSYISVLSTLSVLRHDAFASYFDLSNMDHTLWNTLHGHFFSLRFGEEYVSRLSVHADFILILLSPMYLIWDDVRALIISESIFLGIGAIPTYLIAKKLLKDKGIALLFAFVYLINPAMMWTDIYDFHAVSLAIPFLLFAFYFASTKQWKWYALFAFLALLTKEQISLFIFMLGLFIIFVFKEKKIGILSCLVGLVWFVSMVFIIIPSFSPSGTHWGLEMYQGKIAVSEQNSSAISMEKFRVFIEPETIGYYNLLLSSFGYLPLIGFPWLLLSGPELGINVLGVKTMQQITYHYDSGITPALVIASIYGVYYIYLFFQSKKKLKKYAKRVLYLVSVIMLVVAIRTNYYYSPLPTTPACWCFMYNVTEEDRQFEKVLQSLPKDASITASVEIRPHVNHRTEISNVPIASESAQFIALITENRLVGNYDPKGYENELIPILLNSKHHKLSYKSEHFYLFERIDAN
jgi:uncharacterized membrane protein